MEGGMPTIEVDFETFKQITIRRRNESDSEGDVVRRALGLEEQPHALNPQPTLDWFSEGVKFKVGTKLRHQFRSGKVVEATISSGGVQVNGKTFGALSPAAISVTGNSVNGWRFWEVQQSDGRWILADKLKNGSR
jgi:hypothetical protein